MNLVERFTSERFIFLIILYISSHKKLGVIHC